MILLKINQKMLDAIESHDLQINPTYPFQSPSYSKG